MFARVGVVMVLKGLVWELRHLIDFHNSGC